MTFIKEDLDVDAVVLRNWISQSGESPTQFDTQKINADDSQWVKAVHEVLSQSPFRQMGRKRGDGKKGNVTYLSVAMTNCGGHGWVSDGTTGYSYQQRDPLTGAPWPTMPPFLEQQAGALAAAAGYPNFRPDVCLINQYRIGARLAMHKDEDEEDLVEAPIVSVSLGLPCTFLWGGVRTDRPTETDISVHHIKLSHGDAVVWGGKARLGYHAVLPLAAVKRSSYAYTVLGGLRWNLTFRMAVGKYTGRFYR